MKYIQEYGAGLLLSVTFGITGLLSVLIRKILTNEKALNELRQEIKHRDDLANKDNEKINMIYEQVQEIRSLMFNNKS